MGRMSIPDGQLKLIPVPVSAIDQAWREGAEKLTESCDPNSETTPDQLKMLLLRGDRSLVRMDDETGIVGWAAHRIDIKPNFRVFHITNLYARGAHFERFFGQVKEFAEAYGCFRVWCSCKEVQARLYKQKLKFKSVYETLEVVW
jgi:hypothetical protein